VAPVGIGVVVIAPGTVTSGEPIPTCRPAQATVPHRTPGGGTSRRGAWGRGV